MSRRLDDALEPGLSRLAAAEREIPLLAGRPEREAHFRRLGTWLVEERLLVSLLHRRALGRPTAAPARLADIGVARLLRALATPPRWQARCRAEALFVKTHLRAFYGEPGPFTLKLVAQEARDAIVRESKARRDAGGVAAPRVLAEQSGGPFPYLCEEVIAGRHPDPVKDADAVVAFVLGELWGRYRESGFSWRSCAESHDWKALLANFHEMIDAFAPRLNQVLSRQLPDFDDESSRLIPWCVGHGDLSVGNMLIGEDQIVLLDWERTRRMPLFVELAKVVVTCPGAWTACAARALDEFGQLAPPGMASLKVLGTLASLERFAALRVRFSAPTPDSVRSRTEARRFRRRLNAELAHLAVVLA